MPPFGAFRGGGAPNRCAISDVGCNVDTLDYIRNTGPGCAPPPSKRCSDADIVKIGNELISKNKSVIDQSIKNINILLNKNDALKIIANSEKLQKSAKTVSDFKILHDYTLSLETIMRSTPSPVENPNISITDVSSTPSCSFMTAQLAPLFSGTFTVDGWNILKRSCPNIQQINISWTDLNSQHEYVKHYNISNDLPITLPLDAKCSLKSEQSSSTSLQCASKTPYNFLRTTTYSQLTAPARGGVGCLPKQEYCADKDGVAVPAGYVNPNLNACQGGWRSAACINGSQIQTYIITANPNEAGCVTTNNTEKTISCTNCVGSWSDCDQTTLKQTYTISKPKTGDGEACPFEDKTVRACTNCVGSWSDCDQTTLKQTYTVSTPASNGGKACPVADKTVKSCVIEKDDKTIIEKDDKPIELEPEPESTPSFWDEYKWWIVGGGAGVLLLIFVVIAFIIMSKKPKLSV